VTHASNFCFLLMRRGSSDQGNDERCEQCGALWMKIFCPCPCPCPVDHFQTTQSDVEGCFQVECMVPPTWTSVFRPYAKLGCAVLQHDGAR
jgi:hypothetical protein